MKKFSILMSVLVILSMFLVACGAADNADGTLVPTTDTMETVEPLPGTSGTATTKAPEATATEPSVTMEATAAVTGTASTGLPSTGNQGMGNAVLLSVMMDTDVRMVGNVGGVGTGDQASTPAATQAITGTATTDAVAGSTGVDGQDFGDVQDMIVNLCTQEILWVIIDADDDVAGDRTNDLMIPYEALQWVRGNNPADADDDRGYFMLNGSVNASVIQGAPDVDVLTLDFNMSDWDVDLNAYWSTEIKDKNKDDMSSSCTFSTTGMSGSTLSTPAATEEQGMETTATVGMMGISDDGIVLASNLLGMNVMDTAGEDVGEVNDVVVLINGAGLAGTGDAAAGSTGSAKATSTPQATKSSSGAMTTGSKMMGDLRYIVVGSGGILGIGERNIPVPATAVSYDEMTNSLIVNMDSEAFSASPTIELDDLDTVNWSVDIDAYWTSSYNR